VGSTTDVVIVGGGIGGAALAGGLARGGLGVIVLEASTEFEDRVRGESMQAWGVAEARALGVEQVLLDAGAHVTGTWRIFEADGNERTEIPMAFMVPGIDGSLNLRHPVACQALLDDAAAAGARVVRGVRDVTLEGGASPRVTYGLDRATEEVAASLVVGADGRASTIRRQCGITLEKAAAISYIAGLLLEDIPGVPDDHDVLVSDEGRYSLLFHQGGGRARTYVCTGLSGQHRFSGRTGTDEYLAALASSGHPSIAACAEATVAGPCANYPGDDTWTETPFAEGVVLIGDAAGHNDPIIGQGLSIALRDARTVRDLVLDGARTPEAFAPYAEERVSRMARLRLVADILAVTEAEDADNQSARRQCFAASTADPDTGLLVLMCAAFAGPESVPEELVDPSWVDRIRAA